MPATRPRASFEPIPPNFDVKALVEATPNFSYVDRISVDMIDQQGLIAFEKLVLLHVIVGGKPLVIDGYEERLDPWTFTPKWLRDNCGDKVETSRNLTNKNNLPLTMGHYLKNMSLLTNQFFEKPGAYKEKGRQRVYLKDIDCPPVWQDKLREHIPSLLFYLNDSTGDPGGPGAAPESNVSGRRLGKGIARAGDLMSSLPTDMRAENLMCYIGHEGTYTPAHREMCASLGQNIMVEASGTVSEDGKPEKPGSSIWFMTESKDRHTVSEYWLSVLGHDIEVETHFAQVVAWKKAPFNVYVVEQRPGDFILIPPLAPHQVWNRGTRTIKVAWNRTTAETLDMALNEALPRSRIVCRDEQYKNKAIVYYTLQKYSGLLQLAQQQAASMPTDAAKQLLYNGKLKQLIKDFKRLFNMYKQILLSEMFSPDDRDNSKTTEYLPFDSNVTCAYCRGNIFNRFLTCPSCKDVLGHHEQDGEGDPYDVCMDCYAMGRSCGCISNLKWVEQFRWKELASRYDNWRKLIISLDGGQITGKTPLPLSEERRKLGKKSLAEVCRDQLKRRPWKDIHKTPEAPKEDDEEEDEEIIVGDDGQVKKVAKKKSKTWLKNNSPCHICCHRHPNWRMARCTDCERWWCYGSLFRGWDKMPIDIMQDQDWKCPHCLGICFAGACRREGKMTPYEPKGTLLGHDTRKVADARSVEALVDFSVSNLNWLKDDADAASRAESNRLKQARAEAQKAKAQHPQEEDEEEGGNRVDESNIEMTQVEVDESTPIDPALDGGDDEETFARRLQQATSSLPPPAAMVAGEPPEGAPEGYAPAPSGGYVPPTAEMYGSGYVYPSSMRPTSDEPEDRLLTFGSFHRKRPHEETGEDEEISMLKNSKTKKPRLSAAGFRSTDLADPNATISKAKNEAQRQFEKEKERKALEKAKVEGRYIMLQAALKGKKRVVKMNLSGARLAQAMAQRAARAALSAGPEVDAEHEIDDNAPHATEDASPDGDLLKSDLAPKQKENPKDYYTQRQRDGYVITSTTKKARIPVERDENYGYRPKADRKEKQTQSKKRKAGTVEYEEVDIGSDADDNGDGLFIQQRTNPRERRRRASDGEDDAAAPLDALPINLRNHPPPSPKANSKVRKPAKTPQTAEPVVASKQQIGRTAGKRPSMRPAQQSLGIRLDESAGEDDDEEDFVDVDDLAQASFAAINKPAINGTKSAASRPNTNGASASTSKAAAIRQRAINEENRVAKLQAFEMLDDDDDEDFDGESLASSDEVPAVARAKKVVG